MFSKLLLIALFAISGIFAADIKWYDYGTGVAEVKAKKKPAIIDFYTDWCHWCKVMDEKTFNEAKVKDKLIKKFVAMRINPEKSTETITFEGKSYKPMDFAQALGVQGFPALAFMDSKGKLITLIPGYIPPETFIQILGYIETECYAKGMSFEDWQKKAGKCKN
ncbi:MAG: thioredoxin fold domain-containing protein [Fibrobacteres bacterium]|nr:thioredoxin fold domain-containing protein [Fibrobacterota bacterium]